MQVEPHWTDETSRHFNEEHLQKVCIETQAALQATQRLRDILAQAKRDCES